MVKKILSLTLSKLKSPLLIIVLLISVTMSLANSAQYFIELANTPKNTVYLGTTFYYMDYFFYLNHFFQGAHGVWLTVNRFTGENTPKSIIYWPNILMGKIGGIVGFSPITSYNVYAILISFLVLITSAYLLKKIFPSEPRLLLAGFIFSTFATSLLNHINVNGNTMWYPFELWKTPDFAFNRLGNVPHQLLQTLLFFLLTIVYFDKNQTSKIRFILIALLSSALTSLQPATMAIFVISVIITSGWLFIYKNKLNIAKLACLGIFSALTFIYVNHILHTPPHLYAILWDGYQQDRTTIPFLLLSVGPISFLALLGIIFSVTSKKPLLIFAIVLTALSYALFLSPVPKLIGISNLRILAPALYPFLGTLAAIGTAKITQLQFIKAGFRNAIFTLIILIFFLASFPTLVWEINNKLHIDHTSSTLFLPEKIYQGFNFLEGSGNFNDITLGNPATNIDVMIPALSGHTTYSGHDLTTIDAATKKNLATGFYYLTLDNPEVWLAENHIKYVIFTKYDGNLDLFRQHYPFLKIIFQNADVSIFAGI